MPERLHSAKVRAILLDIEGTTTPIDFVTKTLFPYAAENAEKFLQEHSAETGTLELVAALRRQHALDSASDSSPVVWQEGSLEQRLASAGTYVRWLIARDSKVTPLKSLQGKIWEEGYRQGVLKGEVYADVPVAFERWQKLGLRIAIFSSGSVLAQQLLFKYSCAGDLSPFLEAYFDTTTGPKRESSSYARIAAALRLTPNDILFLSDVTAELDAARDSGMSTRHSLRPGVTPSLHASHTAVETFDSLLP